MEISLSELSRHPIENALVNGIEYYFVRKGEGPTIFFIHGFPDLAGTWDGAIDELSKDYQCVAVFMRGYYPTGMPEDGNYHPHTVAQDILALADHLKVEQFYAIGQDWGAFVSYVVANLAPERVKKFIAIAIPHPRYIKLGPIGLYKARHFIRFRDAKSSLDYTRKNDFAYIDKLFRRWSPNWTNYRPTFELIRRTFRLEGRLEGALGYYWSMTKARKNPDKTQAKQVYGRPKVPFLCLVGKSDGALLMKPFQAMQDDLGELCQVRYHDQAGHFLQQEAPEFLLKETQRFLSE